MTTRKRAVVLLSGGIDSSTTLAVAKSEGHELYAITFDYNQKHKRELQSACMIAEALSVKKHLLMAFDLREIGGSALTSGLDVPKTSARIQTDTQKDNNARHPHSIPVTYVPARNTIFLSFALSWAEVLEAENIYIGANAIDYSGYPDCRPEYLTAFEHMANLATKASVEQKMHFSIQAPLLYLKKSDIIRKGTELGLDYALTWSCYDPQKVNATLPTKEEAPFLPCGICDSCMYRAKGFAEAGLQDPFMK